MSQLFSSSITQDDLNHQKSVDLESQEIMMNDLKYNPNIYSNIDYSKLSSFSGLENEVQVHLQKVYFTLALLALFCCAGSYIYLYTFMQINPAIAFFLSIIAAIYLRISATPNMSKETIQLRYIVLIVFAFLQGFNAGVIVESLLDVDPNYVIFGALASLAIFCSFTGAALLAKRRSFLYLGSILFCALFLLMLHSFVNTFIFSTYLGEVLWLYGGN
jgi:FtsH-binding integral membrane protein